MAEHEEPARCALDRDPPLHRGVVARRDGAHGDHAIGERVDPAAIAQSHLERGRDGQQPPAVPRIDQHAQPAGAHDVVRIPRNGEQLVERRVADRELGGEDTVHPAGRAQRRFVREHRLAGAQQRSVATRHDPLLVAQDDVAVVRKIGREERQQPVATEFFEKPLAITLLQSSAAQRRDVDRGCVLDEAASDRIASRARSRPRARRSLRASSNRRSSEAAGWSAS